MEQKSKGKQVELKVANLVNRLNDINMDGSRAGKRSPWATSMLAKLRRAVGSTPGEYADIWEITLSESTSDPKVEWALHTALTLFALHQQGNSDNVSEKDVRFGTALQQICAKDPNKEQGVIRRFNALATADSLLEFSNHARGLVQLMKQASVKMDYARFAQDLYWYQFDSFRNQTRMQWGRDFYKTNKSEENEQ